MVRTLFLQSIYNIVDESMEKEMYDSVRFINFLDYPERVPDKNTIWLFREKGITVRNGTIQDAAFIESDPGHKRRDKPDIVDPQMPPVGADNRDASTQPPPRVERKSAEQRAEERRSSKTRRSKDGTWTKKNSKSYFGFKLHTIQGVENDMIANYAVTTASVHDSQRDLSIPGVVNYKDRGYFSVEGRGIDATMDRAVSGHRCLQHR